MSKFPRKVDKRIWILGASGLLVALCVLFYVQQTTCPRSLEHYPKVEDINLQDQSLRTGKPCRPPCWQRIVPGETTAVEAQSGLASLPFVDASTIVEVARSRVNKHGRINWTGALPNSPDGQIFYDSSMTVDLIRVSLHHEVLLQDIIALLGAPDGYIAYLQPGFEIGMTDYYYIDFVWLDQGFSAGLYFGCGGLISSNGATLSPDMLFIYDTSYFTPVGTPTEYLEANGFSDTSYYINCCYRKWEGMQPIVIKNPP
jgi:hypothetical protein